MVEEEPMTDLNVQLKSNVKNNQVLNDITNDGDKDFVSPVSKKNLGVEGKKVGKSRTGAGSMGMAVREENFVRKTGVKEASFYLKNPKAMVNNKGKETISSTHDNVTNMDSDDEFEDSSVLAAFHQEIHKDSNDDLMPDPAGEPEVEENAMKISVEDNPFEEVAPRLKEAMIVSLD
ncbi:hypothetical protein ACOSP7_013097 [Xanthoceras sorbifolium]